jgi:hypothetical protein
VSLYTYVSSEKEAESLRDGSELNNDIYKKVESFALPLDVKPEQMG